MDLVWGKTGQGSLVYFLRHSDNLIDWVRHNEKESWQAANISEATAHGVDFALTGSQSGWTWTLRYTLTELEVDRQGLESKYALNVARHDIGARFTLPEWGGFSLTMDARYREVPTLDSYTLVAARLARALQPVTFFVQGRNLLNEQYEEIPGVPTAGRSLEFGVEYAW